MEFKIFLKKAYIKCIEYVDWLWTAKDKNTESWKDEDNDS